MAGAPAAKAIPRESGSAINATLMAAMKSLCQFSINPLNPVLGSCSIGSFVDAEIRPYAKIDIFILESVDNALLLKEKII